MLWPPASKQTGLSPCRSGPPRWLAPAMPVYVGMPAPTGDAQPLRIRALATVHQPLRNPSFQVVPRISQAAIDKAHMPTAVMQFEAGLW